MDHDTKRWPTTAITRDDLKSDPQRVLELARRPGGVEVTNADGTHAFRLSIPAEALPTIWHWIAWSKDRERICDCGTARATNEATARAIAWQVHRVVLLIVDHDDVGADGVLDVIETTRYPNRCIAPAVMRIETCEVDWNDEHPINNRRTRRAEFARLFP